MTKWGIQNRSDAAASAAIREVLVAISRATDTFDDELMLELFTHDGEWWRPGREPLRGQAQIGEHLRGRDRGLNGRHIATNMLVDVQGPDRATAISYYTFLKAAPDGGPVLASMGEYHDVFRLEQGRWRVARRETRRVFRANS